MNKGVEILLKRMESSPDEFLTGNKSGKWLHLMEQYEDYMEPEDRKALMDKYNSLKMQKFTEKVMKELLEEQQEKSEEFGNYISAAQQRMQQAQLQQQYANNASAQAALQQQYAQNQAGALGMGSAGQIYMSNGAGSIQPLAQSNHLSSEIHLGKQTLTEKTLKKLKALIK